MVTLETKPGDTPVYIVHEIEGQENDTLIPLTNN